MARRTWQCARFPKPWLLLKRNRGHLHVAREPRRNDIHTYFGLGQLCTDAHVLSIGKKPVACRLFPSVNDGAWKKRRCGRLRGRSERLWEKLHRHSGAVLGSYFPPCPHFHPSSIRHTFRFALASDTADLSNVLPSFCRRPSITHLPPPRDDWLSGCRLPRISSAQF